MRRLVALALVLGLGVAADAASSARRALYTNARAVDGIYRPARARRHKLRSKKRPGTQTGVVSSHPAGRLRTPSPPPAALPSVTEIDLEGLKKLLQPNSDPSQARPLLVNFWATWCDPCRAEFPDLVKLNNDYKDRGLQFIVVSGDDISEIKTGVPKFLQQMRAPMPAYLLNAPDMEAAINAVDATWGGDMPATYLYDRDGKIVFKHFGRVDPKELRAALDKVLADK
jgi:thiol-disulfide isomerase/thioredoxin